MRQSIAPDTHVSHHATSIQFDESLVVLIRKFILLLLIGISALGFALYNKLITCNPVGKVAIYNSLIPVVGALTSCLCLGEAFYWKYVLAAALATAGIYIINKQKNG